MGNIVGWLVGAVSLFFTVYGLLSWLKLPIGGFGDWVAGAAIFLWLLTIATVPWNIHFQAREVIVEAEQSRERGIPIDRVKVEYARMLARRALIVAIAVHLATAAGLYFLGLTRLGTLGYIGAIAALLLTVLRPLLRFYQFLVFRLRGLLQEVTYPREDVVELRHRVNALEDEVKRLAEQLDAENPYSYVAKHQAFQNQTLVEQAQLRRAHEDLAARQAADAVRLADEAQQAIAQLSEDARFLGQVRELIRFFKQA
ncbi:MAG TPA: hypothetical protein DCQ32_06235 [Cyanobacteria bacterium UBA8156]|jgi:hypothetical protein|nr:hypothetical protein [Cyanobacteria bacterium UBA8156]